MLKISQEIKKALHMENGIRNTTFHYKIYHENAFIREVKASGTISLDSQNTIERTAKLKIYDNNIDWLNDVIVPEMSVKLAEKKYVFRFCYDINKIALNVGEINRFLIENKVTCNNINQSLVSLAPKFISFPLGKFIPSTPTKQIDESGQMYFDVECYEKSVILKEDCLTSPLLIKSGTSYLQAVQNILIGSGISNILVADICEKLIPMDKEFEVGKSKLEIINMLLAEINFCKLKVDEKGNFIIKNFVMPSARISSYTYQNNNLSVLYKDTSSQCDTFNVPNIFLCTMQNPEQEELRSIYINDNPTSKFSTVARKRNIVKILEPPDSIASQEDLNKYVTKQAFETYQLSEYITFSTALMPIHQSEDVLYLDNEEISGKFLETSWEMNLEDGGKMIHKVRSI